MSTQMNEHRNPGRKKKKKRRGPGEEASRGTYILPNLFTTGNLFAGFYGIVSSINGQYFHAAVAILVSCVFDILDGKVARFTKATSRFGVEYDSLADLVAFGVGPGLLIYLWALQPFGRLGWLAAFLFVACGALRLARFNVQAGQGGSKYFVGLPIPGAACMIATTVLFLLKVKGKDYDPTHVVFLLETYVLGFLMVSSIPFNSFKEMEVIKGKPLPTLFVLVLFLTVVAAKPPVMLFLLFSTYVLSGPVAYVVRALRKRRAPETCAEDPQEHAPPAGSG
ncbi:MAG: CDP-diacylglycerol--serine O-phosphatidyltransferase [Desulfacinum sp.]|nr:CDP-diacylglycerol--serine O-phosphatidyltransferase [Desulfacinum sp.]MBZ4660702.1 pssA [Desulfacinum sp.]